MLLLLPLPLPVCDTTTVALFAHVGEAACTSSPRVETSGGFLFSAAEAPFAWHRHLNERLLAAHDPGDLALLAVVVQPVSRGRELVEACGWQGLPAPGAPLLLRRVMRLLLRLFLLAPHARHILSRPFELLGLKGNHLAGRLSRHLQQICGCCIGGCSFSFSLRNMHAGWRTDQHHSQCRKWEH